MTNNSEPERTSLDPEILRGLADTIGVALTDDRLAALTPQAEAHFVLLRRLASAADPHTEPAALFQLDQRAKSAHE